jgi:hypothetical protein
MVDVMQPKYPLHSTTVIIVPYRLLVAQILLVGLFGMLIAGVLGLMHYVNLPYNPFAEYANIFPGKPSSALNEHGFLCGAQDYGLYQSLSDVSCKLYLESGTFYSIGATYSEGVISVVHFEVRDGVLSLGDLAAFLGVTQISHKPPFTFYWQGRIGLAGLSRPHSPYYLVVRSVWQVTLMNR